VKLTVGTLVRQQGRCSLESLVSLIPRRSEFGSKIGESMLRSVNKLIRRRSKSRAKERADNLPHPLRLRGRTCSDDGSMTSGSVVDLGALRRLAHDDDREFCHCSKLAC